jgi:hypothetical protein
MAKKKVTKVTKKLEVEPEKIEIRKGVFILVFD